MRIRTLLVILAVLLVAAFVALNWAVFMTPAPLNLLVATIEAPPALVMLALLALAMVVGAIYMAVWQSEILRESRRSRKELDTQRQLAEQVEASRLAELRALVVTQGEQFAERLRAAEAALRAEIRDQSGSIAAMLGEIDHRQSQLQPAQPRPQTPQSQAPTQPLPQPQGQPAQVLPQPQPQPQVATQSQPRSQLGRFFGRS